LTFAGVAPGLTGELTGEATGLAVTVGEAVATGLALLTPPLLLGALLHAPKTAVAARTELIINDLLIISPCALFGLKTRVVSRTDIPHTRMT
jgi:hypothetical protein